MRLPFTTTVPLATGRLFARILTASASEASSSMMAPRPSRRTWWIGIDVVPSTTVMSTATLSSVATLVSLLAFRASGGANVRSPRYGECVVNARNTLIVGVPTPAGSAPAEWRVSDSPVSYQEAVAAMDARAAAIPAGTAPELVCLLEHPPPYPP